MFGKKKKTNNFAEIPFSKQLNKTNDPELDPDLIEDSIYFKCQILIGCLIFNIFALNFFF